MRTVPLSSSLATALKEWRLHSKFSRDEDLIFPNARGGFTDHSNLIKRRFRPVAKGANWHSLRHFAVSAWIEAGLTPKTVQTFAGHASLAITMDRYGNLFPSEDHRRAMDGIANDLFA